MSKIVKHRMKFQVVMMTPTWAQELLDNNHPKNRKPKKHKIEQYGRDMRQGFWELTPEPICVDEDGWTTNGQNRLTACARSGVEVPMTLVTRCPRRSINAQDQGSTRNFADYVKISGRQLVNSQVNNIAAVVRAMHAGLRQRVQLTNAEVIVLASNHDAALRFAFECLPKNVTGITHSTVRAVIARAYYKRNLRNRTREFCRILQDGLVEKKEPDSGAIRLRNWLQDNFLGGVRKKRAVVRVKPVMVYAKTERALSAFHHEEFIESLQESRVELFPLPDETGEDEDAEREDAPNERGAEFIGFRS